MKDINVISTLSVHQQQALNRWKIITVCTLLLLLIGIVLVQSWQLYIFYTVYQQHQKLTQLQPHHEKRVQQKQSLKKETKDLRAKLHKLDRYAQQHKNPAAHLQLLYKSRSNNGELQQLLLYRKKIMLSCITPLLQDILQQIRLLNQSNLFQHMQLLSFKKIDNNHISCTLKGNYLFI